MVGGGGLARGTSAAEDAGSAGGDAGGTCQAAPDTDGGSGPGLIVSEVAPGPGGFVELYNRTSTSYSASDVVIEAFGASRALAGPLAAGGRAVAWFASVPDSGEVVVTVDGAIAAYVCWGQVAPSADQNLAATQGAWLSPGSCALSPPAGESIHATGSGRLAGEYVAGPPSPATCP